MRRVGLVFSLACALSLFAQTSPEWKKVKEGNDAFQGSYITFDKLDANHDGRVVPSEVAAALARERHGQASELVGELVVHALDLDHDDAVSPDESTKT